MCFSYWYSTFPLISSSFQNAFGFLLMHLLFQTNCRIKLSPIPSLKKKNVCWHFNCNYNEYVDYWGGGRLVGGDDNLYTYFWILVVFNFKWRASFISSLGTYFYITHILLISFHIIAIVHLFDYYMIFTLFEYSKQI